MDLGLKDKVIVVTGNAGGFGQAVVKILSDEGALPVLLEHPNDPSSGRQAVKIVTDQFGRIDGLVNNGAVNDGIVPASGFDLRFMESVHEKLLNYFLMTSAVLPFLKISKGAIVNISYHTNGNPESSRPAYAASNGGLNALTREWAVDLLRYGIRVNSVIPAEYRVPGSETGAGTLENTVAFLLSEKNSHTTGQLIRVDAGSVPVVRV